MSTLVSRTSDSNCLSWPATNRQVFINQESNSRRILSAIFIRVWKYWLLTMTFRSSSYLTLQLYPSISSSSLPITTVHVSVASTSPCGQQDTVLFLFQVAPLQAVTVEPGNIWLTQILTAQRTSCFPDVASMVAPDVLLKDSFISVKVPRAKLLGLT